MATPSYKGQCQPVASSGWLGGLGAWFGGVSTPAYAGQGQPSPGTSGYLAGSATAYKPAPVKSSPASTPAAPAATAASSAPASAAPDDPSAMGYGPIAIVIPRDVIEP